MAQSNTVERILDAAEFLFAEKGFAETSMRSITSRADVNLAAVNYHFGSKKVLIQAVFTRFLDPLVQGLTVTLDTLEASGKRLDLKALIMLLFHQTFKREAQGRGDPGTFMRLLAMAYAQSQGHLRRHLQTVYGGLFRRYLRLLIDATPGLPLYELYWRVNFMMGAVIFTLAEFDTLNAIGAAEHSLTATMEETINRLVPFLVSGLETPLSENAPLENALLGNALLGNASLGNASLGKK